ncbi:hypothetical protein IFM89_006509 [Coptis chinensis]|uniref:Uncharacterized protein n=1 Tax=Coptis chinensis TaxID=261450 RepID=A0A835IN79_9MAGN|nr:hypothetical protein IFM89_006509 [Coptis chinensis]
MVNDCLKRVGTGVAVGGALGGAVGVVYGTYEAVKIKVCCVLAGGECVVCAGCVVWTGASRVVGATASMWLCLAEAKAKACGDKISTKRQPEGPKPSFMMEGAILETVTHIPYNVVNDLKGGY